MRTTQPENFKKWLDALRSGEYQQTQRALRNQKSFCCLGVACDISGLGSWAKNDYEYESALYGDLPPRAVLDWLGIPYLDPSLASNNPSLMGGIVQAMIWVEAQDGDEAEFQIDNGSLTSVAVINDGGGLFDEIADRLEATYLG